MSGHEPWEPEANPPPDPDDASDEEWTEDDERRYQARRQLERRATRRRRRQAASFAVVVLIVLGAGVTAAGVYSGWWEWPLVGSADSGTEKVGDPCPTPTVTAAAAKDVTVRVLNSTDRRGLAGAVAAELRKRGFDVSQVGNDAADVTVAEPAQVRHGPEAVPAARTVAAQIPGAVLVADGREGFVVDLSLGTAYQNLATVEQAATLTTPVPGPSPAGCVPVVPTTTGTATGTPTGTGTPTAPATTG